MGATPFFVDIFRPRLQIDLAAARLYRVVLINYNKLEK